MFDSLTFNIFNERCSDFVQNNDIKYDVAFTMAVLMHIDDYERESFYNFLKNNVKYVIFIEPLLNKKKIRKDGRLFNKSDYELQMNRRGFTIISKNQSLLSLNNSYINYIFKNNNL